MKRKNMLIDQRKLDRVKALLGAGTETAAVDAALDEIIFHDELMSGIERVAARGGVGYFDPSDRMSA